MTSAIWIERDLVEPALDWSLMADALRDGHRRAPANIEDVFLTEGANTLLNRSAWIEGLGMAVKVATIFPKNAGRVTPLPNVQSMVSLFDGETGSLRAMLDGGLVTKWKTAGDSVLGAQLLARANSQTLVIVGAGVVAESLVDAYRALFPQLQHLVVWNRTTARAENLAAGKAHLFSQVTVVEDLPDALGQADIVAAATVCFEPLIKGAWIKPGTHVDLIGAYRHDMREADDDLLRKGRLYVDARATTMDHIGELCIPLREGVIGEDDVLGDLYDLCNGSPARQAETDITIYKNGGGAHLDLMTADYIYRVWQSQANQ